MTKKNKNSISNLKTFVDSWTNIVNGLNVIGRDVRLQATPYAPHQMSEFELNNLFHGNDLAFKMVTLKPNAALRKDLEVTSDDEKKTNIVNNKIEELQVKSVFIEALIYAGLYGGSLLYVGIDDGQDISSPVKDSIREVKFLHVYDRYEVEIYKYYSDPTQENFDKPEIFKITKTVDGKQIVFYLHESRCLQFYGSFTTKRRSRQVLNGWSDSILYKVSKVLRGYDTTWDTAESLMLDFSIPKIGIKDLADIIATGGVDALRDRIEIMKDSRSALNVLLLDAENESYSREQTPIDGLPELLDKWIQRVASAADMPATTLFGISPAGLNATGESDTRNWYDMVANFQEKVIRPQLEKLIKYLFISTGSEPENWTLSFKPLWQPTERETAETRKIQAETDAIYAGIDGGLTGEEIISNRFGGNRYSYETKVDLELRKRYIEANAELERKQIELEIERIRGEEGNNIQNENNM